MTKQGRTATSLFLLYRPQSKNRRKKTPVTDETSNWRKVHTKGEAWKETTYRNTQLRSYRAMQQLPIAVSSQVYCPTISMIGQGYFCTAQNNCKNPYSGRKKPTP
jgi:hypothetical protein